MNPRTLILLSALAGMLLAASAQASSHTLVVNNNPANTSFACSHATFNTIQAAVIAASPGDTVDVCPSSYPEQVTITKPLNVIGIESNESNAIVINPAAVPNTTDLYNSFPISAVVLVDGTNRVNLTNLIADGNNTPNASCTPNIVGFYYRNSSGIINRSVARNIGIYQGAITGCQIGLGIFVEDGNGGTANLSVLNSSVHDYNKNGITADTGNIPSGTTLTVKGTAVTGSGPTPIIAQNGIQVADGAKGTLTGNTVIGNQYSQCSSTSNCSYTASNILVYNSDGVELSWNVIGQSNLNVYFQGNHGQVADNTVVGASVYDGIDIVGNYNNVAENSITRSDNDAVYLCGSKNTVRQDIINEATYGIFQDTTSPGCTASTGNKSSENTFFNVVSETNQPGLDGDAMVKSTAVVRPHTLQVSPFKR